MNKTQISILVIIIVLFAGFFAFDKYKNKEDVRQEIVKTDHKNIEYLIDGERVALVDGYAERENTLYSASKTVTRYFGNELFTDLDGDEVEDVAFVLVREYGGTGVFYYAVAAVKRDETYIGSDGYLLGDRVAPQSTNLSTNPSHKNVVVFNYADRKDTEPMIEEPSVGKSAYLKLDIPTMQWGIVEPNFEGESR